VTYYGTLTTAQLQSYAKGLAAQYQIPWPIFYAWINQESGWQVAPQPNPNDGIAQIIPSTAASWGVNPLDPFAALEAAAKHLSEYYTQFGNSWPNALAAYNGGASPQGMAASNANGYAQKILAAAGSSGSSSSSSVSSLSSTASSGAASSSTPSWLQTLHDLPFGIGPAVEAFASEQIVGFAAFTLLAIGGLWLIFGNQTTRGIVVKTAKGAAAASV
jgi:hypothetical protein